MTIFIESVCRLLIYSMYNQSLSSKAYKKVGILTKNLQNFDLQSYNNLKAQKFLKTIPIDLLLYFFLKLLTEEILSITAHTCHKLQFNRKNSLHPLEAKRVHLLCILSQWFSIWAKEFWIKWPFMFHLLHKSRNLMLKFNFWYISANFSQL